MQQQIKDRIIHILGEVVERANSINQPSYQNTAIEIDLVLEDLRLLYREFELLRRQLNQAEETPEPKPEPVYAPVAPEPQVSPLTEEKITAESQPETESKPQAEPEPEPEPELQPESQAEPEPQALAEPQDEPEPEPEQPEPEAKPVPKIEPKPEIVAQSLPKVEQPKQDNEKPSNGSRSVLDLFSAQSTAPSVGERLVQDDNSLHKRIVAQKEDKSIGFRMQMTPVSNLKEAIGVNEKFLFINELFGGNIQAYNDSVSKLNGFDDMQQAFDYLNELNDQLAWDEKRSAQTIEKLANFVQRRYITD